VLAELDSDTKALNDAKAQVVQKLSQAQQLLGSLTRAERAALNADEASRGASRADLTNLPPASGYAATALSAAMGKQGSPYQWGATGPSTFDCSGLMMWAYGKAGVSLPRTSQEQASVGTRVPSLDQAQPGDLLIFGTDYHHVGMYIGNGLMVHAPHTGSYVKVEKVSDMPLAMIRRV
jgi:cell wall-associated NlpC family hydrolase